MKIDCHVHIAGVSEESGCYLSPRMRRSLGLRLLFWKSGLSKIKDPVEQERVYVAALADQVRGSELDRVVLLGLDKVYGASGDVDLKRTHVYVANRFVRDLARAYPDCFLYGASVHPYRDDALDALGRVAEEGAVLCKWLPNSQGFDPGGRRLDKYYRKMADLGLPLLVHAGYEHTVPPIDQAYGDPSRLERALAAGVTVIIAHMGSAGLAHFKETMGAALKLLNKYPNCYGDSAAFCTLWRGKYLIELLDRDCLYRKYRVIIDDPMGRMIHGSDAPIPPSYLAYPFRLTGAERRAVSRQENPLQKDIEIKRLLGVPDACLTRLHDDFGIA